MRAEGKRLRVVFDTNVLLSLLGFPGGRLDALWDLIQRGQVESFTSEFILEELYRNLHTKAKLLEGEAKAVLRLLRQRMQIVLPQRKLHIIREKEADNRILECAVEANADVLVTGNFRHIRPLGSFRGIEILSPREFLDKHFPAY